MSLDVVTDVQWLGVVLGALAWFLLGGVWYQRPVMGERWQKAGAIDVPDQGMNPMVFVLTFVAYLLAATVAGMLAAATGTTTVGEGVVLGLILGVGFALPIAGVTSMYDNKPDPFGWFWINGLLNVVGLTVVGLVIGAFA